MSEVEILHRRPSNDRGGVHRVAARRHGRDVYRRIQIGLRVEAGVVAEWPLGDQRFSRIDVPFDHELRLGGHFEVARHGARERDRRAAEESGEEELIHGRRQRRGRGVDRRRVRADRDAHGHRLTPVRHGAPMRRPHFVALPVHRQGARPEDLHAVHPNVADAPHRIARDHHWQRDVRAAIARPAGQDRQAPEVHVLAARHDLLRRGTWPAHPRWKLGHLEQPREERELGHQPIRHFELHQLGNPPADRVEILGS